jgi:hypothetical protein
MNSAGTVTPVKRASQTLSASKRWLNVPWIDLKNAPPSRLRASSLSVAASP